MNRRRVKDGKTEYVTSRTIRIKFAGQMLPQEVFLFKIRHEVRSYIPLPRICYACHRVGHVSAACKSTPRCLHCGNDKHNEASVCQMQDEASKCINCKGNHWANDRTCPDYKTTSHC
ncbi:hypothetical protein ALC60_13777 [Trachymyrmex zeteki]|uniref:CCHC-type domain-containing protein n=1 Tax=Mycetomoellerius zeteki TaxID=64791 RepID=A0A151WHB4_9HYME|nr:hypothetical protein ALC60_13777 [Trachymyrmex zeteki]